MASHNPVLGDFWKCSRLGQTLFPQSNQNFSLRVKAGPGPGPGPALGPGPGPAGGPGPRPWGPGCGSGPPWPTPCIELTRLTSGYQGS